MTVEPTSGTRSVAIACRDPLFGGALSSAVEASTLRVAALVDSLSRLRAIVDIGETDGIVVVGPSDFPPERVMEIGLFLPVLVVGPGHDASSMIASVEAGALGYADLEAPFEKLVDAITSVMEGVPVIPPLLLGSLLKHVVERQRGHRRARERLEVLSVRERQVFELTARGCDRQAVADLLFISPGTVRTHVQNAFRKLGVHSAAELVALAAECGLEVGSNSQRGLQ